MLSLVQRQPLIAVLAIACAGLVAVIGLETGFGSRLAPAIPSGVSKPAVPAEAKLMPALPAANPEQLYPEMAARPLFVPLRRPAPAAEAAPQSAMKRGQYILQGVTIAGGTRIAMLREKSSGRIFRLEKGRELNGITLAEVSPESVTLAQGREQEVLPLLVQKPGPASPVVAGPFGAGAGGQPLPLPPPNPLATPGHPGFPAPNRSDFGPSPNPGAQPMPQATTVPLSPEELLARRRARRVQQTQ